jgi:superfamily II DNA or RNA helicase
MVAAEQFTVGSIVTARGREWVVVLGDGDPEIIHIRPLGGSEEDVTGILPSIERVRSATFPLPDPDDFGDHISARLLRDAVRLNIRAGAGPFRSFGRIAVEPRPYQLVPLLMALRLEPVRLMIADDVGIGKTIEAGLIARELLDRNEIRRIAVICPAHLCDQWQAELKSKFDLDAEVVRPGTVRRLEQPLSADESVFEAYPFVVVSIDYIKSQRRRDEFLRACPEFVIVDEAHTCSASGRMGGAQQQRHELLQQLVNGPRRTSQERHLILATATPHSGNDDAFRSLLTLLDPAFADLPPDEDLRTDDPLRLKLARHLVQRRRPDIRAYLHEETPFPNRKDREVTWRMSKEGSAFFDAVLQFARSQVDRARGLEQHKQRVSWWAALALMRSSISSPAAAVAALQTKASGISTDSDDGAAVIDDVAAIDEQGQRSVLDVDIEDAAEIDDVVPGADTSDLQPSDHERRRLRELIRHAESLSGSNDPKLLQAMTVIGELLDDGFRPIVFCRYIATAEYVAAQLRKRFRDTEVAAVTGILPPEERKERVSDLGQHPRRVLVATDCLSEGINLQEHFDAVFHYDLAWNPTRHEQRAGRVDRFGQDKGEVRVVMFFGADNPVDLAVMDVLIRKADNIRRRLGVAVSVPQRSGAIMDSVFEAIFHGRGTARQLTLGIEADAALEREEAALNKEWTNIEEREKRSRTIFSQQSIHPELVRQEIEEVRASIGSTEVVERFVRTISNRLNTPLAERNGRALLPLNGMPARVTALFNDRRESGPAPVDFTFPVPEGVYHLSRTSDVVETLATIAIDGALDRELAVRPARRSSAILSDAVAIETTLAVARLRVHLRTVGRTGGREMLAEESLVLGWRWGDDDELQLLPDDEVQRLLDAGPTAIITDAHRQRAIRRALADEPRWRPLIDQRAQMRAEEVLESHRRVRDVAELTGAGRLSAEPMLPVDILGLYVFLPAS